MAIKITRGELVFEVDVDANTEVALEAIKKVFNVSLEQHTSDVVDHPMSRRMFSTPREVIPDVEASLVSRSINIVFKRMPVHECINLILTQKQKLMSPYDLHTCMAFEIPRYRPKSKDPVHNIKQVLRNSEDFKEWTPGLWQLSAWKPITGEKVDSTMRLPPRIQTKVDEAIQHGKKT